MNNIREFRFMRPLEPHNIDFERPFGPHQRRGKQVVCQTMSSIFRNIKLIGSIEAMNNDIVSFLHWIKKDLKDIVRYKLLNNQSWKVMHG